jgi:hypothetical protein
MRTAVAFVALLALSGPALAADNQLRVFLGGTFGGGTTFVDPDHAAGKLHAAVGISHVTLGNIFGVDVDLADTPGFFQTGDSANLVLSSRVTTLTGNLIIAAPRSKTEYGVRPYVIAGAGLMRARLNDYFSSFEQSRVLPAFDVGAGAVGFFTNRAGVAWELRRFESLSRDREERGVTIGKEQLSFWRASMAFVYRY